MVSFEHPEARKAIKMLRYNHWKFWTALGVLRIMLGVSLFAIPALRLYAFYSCPELELAVNWAAHLLAAGWDWRVSSGAFYLPVAMITVVVDTFLFGYLISQIQSIVNRRRTA